MIKKHIVVVNGLWGGHHSVYVKTITRVLLDAGYQVSVFCPAPDEVTSWVNQTFPIERNRFKAHYFSDLEPRLWRYLPGRFRHVLRSLPRWFQASRALKKFYSSSNKPDLVFFAWIDCYLQEYLPARLIDRLFPFRWSGLYFHPRHFRAPTVQGTQRKRRFVEPPENFIAQSKWASSIAVLDAGIVSSLRSKLLGKQAVVLPDFSDEVPPEDHYRLAEEIRAKAKGRKIIGLLGGLSQRKGLLTLVRIAKQNVAKNWYFVFAGILLDHTFSIDEIDEIKHFFSAQREDCFIHLDRIPDDAKFNALVNACDVIFAMYEDFPHSSNLVTKSAIYGKRVLVSTGGYMEEVVRQYKLGEAVPAGDVQAALSALHQLTSDDHSDESVTGMKKFAGMQTQENLKRIFLDLIENSMSCPAVKNNINSYPDRQ